MAKPQSRNQLIDYCLRRLGHPVIEINIDDEQIEDRLDDALQMFMEYNSEGSSRIAQAVTITEAMITNKYIDLNTAFSGATMIEYSVSIVCSLLIVKHLQ